MKSLALDLRQSLLALGESVKKMTLIFRGMPRPPRVVPLHGFTPNYDLVCRHCGVGPEECRGGRA